MIGRTQLSEVEEHLESHEPDSVNQRLADEMAIRLIVDEVDNACDAKDWALLRTFFTEQVEIDFTSLAGGAPARISADELVNGWQTNLYAEKKSFHQRTNHRIEITGHRAAVYSKGYAYNLIETGQVTGLWEVWGDYGHTLERTTDGWRVSGMSLQVRYQRGDETIRTLPKQD